MTKSTTSNVSHHVGDIFTTTAPAWGHGVNCQEGGMRSGLAALVVRRYPEVEATYNDFCAEGLTYPGGMIPVIASDGKTILNIISQRNPGADARLDWLRSGVEHAFQYCCMFNFSSLALPRIGAGIGGLEWKDVKEVLEDVAAQYPGVHLEIWSLTADEN